MHAGWPRPHRYPYPQIPKTLGSSALLRGVIALVQKRWVLELASSIYSCQKKEAYFCGRLCTERLKITLLLVKIAFAVLGCFLLRASRCQRAVKSPVTSPSWSSPVLGTTDLGSHHRVEKQFSVRASCLSGGDVHRTTHHESRYMRGQGWQLCFPFHPFILLILLGVARMPGGVFLRPIRRPACDLRGD
ncbi:hypothetical protein F4780DRAFT_344445 [Xylariomycetidae sp. FL0641]|nr:hypothetical protein F4780DRAFT_344445 [Xylariomycetidae sp. FL0641]